MEQISTEVLVIGAGSAGLCAAYQAASAGAKVTVVDENSRPGGQLFKQIHKFFGSREHQAGKRGFIIGQELLDKVQSAGATVMLDSLVYALLQDKSIGVISNGTNYSVNAKKIIIATGAKENYTAFPGSTLPGVMGAGAAQTMININRVLPGQRILMIGSGNVGLIVSYQLMQAGAEVVALVEGSSKIGGYGVHAAKIRRAGVPIYVNHTIKRVYGNDFVEKAEIIAVDENWNTIPGSEKTFDVDTVCLALGLNPMTELAWMAGCKFDFIKGFGGHVPLHDQNMESTVEGIYVAGDITGTEESATAMDEGNLAGIAAAESLGYISHEKAAVLKEQIWHRLNSLRSGYFGASRKSNKELQLSNMLIYKNSLKEETKHE